jgi:outer membrane protein assembly factor BamB/DNA-binding transcriptional ArsR family regulator
MPKATRAATLCFLLLLVAVPAIDAQLSGASAGRGNASATATPANLVAWVNPVQVGAPVVSGGIVVAVSEPSGGYAVSSFGATTGDKLWETVLYSQAERAAASASNLLQVSPPTVDRGSLYVVDTAGKVWALDAATGRLVWTETAGGALPWGMATASPLVRDGALFVFAQVGSSPSQVALRRLDLGSRQWVWSADATPTGVYAQVLGRVAGDGSTVVADVYESTGVWKIRAWDASTGVPLWERANDAGHSWSSVALSGSRAFASATKLEAGSDLYGHLRIYALDARTGAQAWEFNRATPSAGRGFDGWASSGPFGVAVSGSNLAARGWDGLYMLDAGTGALRWRQDLGGPLIGPPVLTSDGVIAARNHNWAADSRAGPYVQAFSHSGSLLWGMDNEFGPWRQWTPTDPLSVSGSILVMRNSLQTTTGYDGSGLVAMGLDNTPPRWAPDPGQQALQLVHHAPDRQTLYWNRADDLNLARVEIQARNGVGGQFPDWTVVQTLPLRRAYDFDANQWTLQVPAEYRVVPIDRANQRGEPSPSVFAVGAPSPAEASTGSSTSTTTGSGGGWSASATTTTAPCCGSQPTYSGGPSTTSSPMSASGSYTGSGGGGGGGGGGSNESPPPSSGVTSTGSSSGRTFVAAPGRLAIDSPAAGSVVTGIATIRGHLTDPEFIGQSGLVVWASITDGDEPVTVAPMEISADGTFAIDWDTTAGRGDPPRILPDGEHTITISGVGSSVSATYEVVNGNWVRDGKANVTFEGPTRGPLWVNVTWRGESGFDPAAAWVVVRHSDGQETRSAATVARRPGSEPGSHALDLQSSQRLDEVGPGAVDVRLEFDQAVGAYVQPLAQRPPSPGTHVSWNPPPASEWAAPAAGLAAGGLAALVGFTEAGRFWLMRIAPIGLFSRITGDQVLQNKRREQLIQLIEGRPGITFKRLSEASKVRGGSLAHHLATLEREGLVRRQRVGLRMAFYPAGAAAAVRQLPSLQAALLRLVGKQTMTQAEAARRLGVSRQSLHYHVSLLRDAGLLDAVRQGRETALGLTDVGKQRLWACPRCRSLLEGPRLGARCPACGAGSGAPGAGAAAAG